jgi:hypothetical protein
MLTFHVRWSSCFLSERGMQIFHVGTDSWFVGWYIYRSMCHLIIARGSELHLRLCFRDFRRRHEYLHKVTLILSISFFFHLYSLIYLLHPIIVF